MTAEKPENKEERAARRKAERPRGFLRVFVPAAGVLLIVTGAVWLLCMQHEYQAAKAEYASLDALVTARESLPEEPAAPAATGEASEPAEDGPWAGVETEFRYPDFVIDYEEYRRINSRFLGVLYVPALKLRYPVVAAEDYDTYLTTTFEGTRNAAGAIFLDYTASQDLSDANTFVFGHNMRNGTMFGSLKRFVQEPELCASDPYCYFYTPDAVLKYEIFSCYVTDYASDSYAGFDGEEGYDAYLAKIRERSLYKPEEEIDFHARPRLLTLSTCSGSRHVERFLVHAALIGRHISP
ncbi:class B sortase [Lachnoclostridium sp. Marseille-P6806]|uniref:class B sortase n=1 Tax=Lachnoclostridium sp. Marseille-P6806 TaxID=2364793 RepID=UPI00102F43B9|nr:class B sortase [Lachnoclostridium sp. Marseille-P6806]